MIVLPFNEKLHCYMSEDNAPFTEDEMPRPWTKEDDEINEYLIKKHIGEAVDD